MQSALAMTVLYMHIFSYTCACSCLHACLCGFLPTGSRAFARLAAVEVRLASNPASTDGDF